MKPKRTATAALIALSLITAGCKSQKEAAETAETADGKADAAVSTANIAKNTADATAETVQQEHEQMTAEIEELAQAIADGGTTVKRNGEALAIYEVDNVIETTDTITLDGGDV